MLPSSKLRLGYKLSDGELPSKNSAGVGAGFGLMNVREVLESRSFRIIGVDILCPQQAFEERLVEMGEDSFSIHGMNLSDSERLDALEHIIRVRTWLTRVGVELRHSPAFFLLFVGVDLDRVSCRLLCAEVQVWTWARKGGTCTSLTRSRIEWPWGTSTRTCRRRRKSPRRS